MNAWEGIGDDFFIGSYLLPKLSIVLEEVLLELMKDVPTAACNSNGIAVWFQHDGVPSHLKEVLLNYPNASFEGPWFGRDGRVRCPSHLDHQINQASMTFYGAI